jgi:hypothetical protein
MQVDAFQRSVAGLFTVPFQYRVPLYQRPYAWGPREIDQFWTDITESGTRGHFIGPIVVYKTDKKQDKSPREVIDGQQRLTTLHILLALVRDKYDELDDKDAAAEPHELIWGGAYKTGDDKFRFRSGDQNWKVLRDYILLRKGDTDRKDLSKRTELELLDKTERSKNRRLIAAWNRLHKDLEQHLSKSDRPKEKLQALESKVVNDVESVVIEVTDLEDAFLLFETLNDRGLELSAADLLKSHLLSKLASKTNDKTVLMGASDDWDGVVDTLGGGDITGFLRHFLLMSHTRVQKRDIFPFFKDDVKETGPGKLLDELLKMGKIYAGILNPPSDDKAAEVLLDIQQIGSDTYRIALLAARRWITDDGRFIRFARLVESMAFRWIVVGNNAQDLENTFQKTAAILSKSEGAQYDEAISTLEGGMPSADDFRQKFRAERLGKGSVASYMLRRIENFLVPSEKSIKPRTEVHVEHIMPVTSTSFWLERVPDPENYDDVIVRWGNLTLLKSELNSAIQNSDWDTKREQGYGDSKIQLTQELLALEDWHSESIDIRQQWLALAASYVWSPEAARGQMVKIPSYAAVREDPAAHGISATPAEVEEEDMLEEGVA